MFYSTNTHTQSADFWSVSNPQRNGPGDTRHFSINTFPSLGACLAPSWSHLKPWGSVSPAPPILASPYPVLYRGGGGSLESSPILSPFPGPPQTPSPQPPARSQVSEFQKNLETSAFLTVPTGAKAQKWAGTCLRSHSKHIGIPGQGPMLLPFNRRGALFPHLRAKGGETLGPGGRASVRAGSVPASFSHWNAALREHCPPTHTHTPILGTHPRAPSAALGTGPAPGNPLQAGRSQQAWRLQVRESLPLWRLSPPLLKRLLSLPSRKRNGPREGQALEEVKQDGGPGRGNRSLTFWSLCLPHDCAIGQTFRSLQASPCPVPHGDPTVLSCLYPC